MARLTAEQRRDLMEVIDDRHQRASTILATQIPIERWHDTIGDPTYADAILDRLVHNAYRIELRGDSMRRRKPDMPGMKRTNQINNLQHLSTLLTQFTTDHNNH